MDGDGGDADHNGIDDGMVLMMACLGWFVPTQSSITF